MRARLRFIRKPFFNYPPRLVAPGKLIGRAEDRIAWTMVFTVTKQISALVYEGDLRWLIEPREQDFGRGVRFQFISFAGGKLAGKDKDRRDKLEQDRRDRREAQEKKEQVEREARGEPAPQAAKPPKDDGRTKKAKEDKGAGGPPVDPGPPGGQPPGQPQKPPKPPGMNLPDDAFGDRSPVLQGIIAEGELLG